MRILLISNSTMYGRGYLDHAESEIVELLGRARKVLFVPFAMHDLAAYAAKAKARFESMGYAVESIHEASDAPAAVDQAEALFIGGGNTFRLLDALYRRDLLEPIRRRVSRGAPFIGSSAGSIVAGPSIKTTKDMPIVQPPSFLSLGLVPFQISPHYLDPDPASTHMGETQEERIQQFLEENDAPVLGLREGGMLRAGEGLPVLRGSTPARIFRRGSPPVEAVAGSTLEML
ncbi:MAG TPA: dipeptidase PepE [Candidatus Krumholzibacteria bacterium]|nr:dipeptidase PepE [Candidatus Krumholzibacteria bacterium]